MANGNLRAFLSGGLGDIQRQRQQVGAFQQNILGQIIQQQIQSQIQQQSPQAQLQQQILQQFFGQGGQGGQQGLQPGGLQQPSRITPDQFRGLSGQQIQGLIPQGGFTPGVGLPSRGSGGAISQVGAQPQARPQPQTQPGGPGGLQQFITQPNVSIGPTGLTTGFSRVANPAIAQRQQMFQRATTLRKEFTTSTTFKDFQEIRAQVSSMDALLGQARAGALDINNALDQALITIFNKINDPGSVVRESEFARTAANLPFANRVAGTIEKFRKGGAGLTTQDRFDLVQAAKIIANERGKIFNEERNRFEDLAGGFGVRRGLVTGGIQKFNPFGIQKGGSFQDLIPTDLEQQLQSFQGSVPSGNTFRIQ